MSGEIVYPPHDEPDVDLSDAVEVDGGIDDAVEQQPSAAQDDES
jgi:hypothetical protein